jgi:hypothetical protein
MRIKIDDADEGESVDGRKRKRREKEAGIPYLPSERLARSIQSSRTIEYTTLQSTMMHDDML